MKKRLLALALSVLMVLSILPVTAFAEDGYEMVVSGTSDNTAFYDNVKGIDFTLQYAGPSVGTADGIAAILFVYDHTKLELIPYGATDVIEGGTSTGGLTAMQTYNDEPLYGTKHARVSAVGFYGMKLDDTYSILQIQTTFSRTFNSTTTPVTAATFRMGFKGETTLADIDRNAFRVGKTEEGATAGQNCVAAIPSGTGSSYQYAVNSNGAPDKELGAPAITVNGKELPAGVVKLTGYDVSLSKNAVNLNGSADSLTATATAKPDGATAGTIAWTVSPTGKGVTIDNKGAVTIAKTAEANTYTVTAATGTATGSATFTVTRAAAELKTFTASVAAPTSVKVPQSGTNASGNVSFTIQDQYGANITATPTVKGTLPTGITYSGGKLNVGPDATTGAKTITFTVTSGSVTKEANVTLTVALGDGKAAPTGLGKTDATTKGGKGTLTGTTADMEYHTNRTATSGWTTCADGSTEVPAGSYYVRYKAVPNKYAAGAATTTALTVTAPGTSPAPTVAVTPASAQLSEKVTSVDLTAAVSGTGVTEANCTFQWKKDGTNISGATSKTYTATEAGTYTCVVTHTRGNDDPATGTSNEAVVTMKTRTNMTLTPKTGEVSLTANEDGKFTWKLSDVVGANAPIDFDVVATDDPAVFVNEEMGITVTFKVGDEKAESIETGTEYKVEIEVADDVKIGDDYLLKGTETPVVSTITFVVNQGAKYDEPYIKGVKQLDNSILFEPESAITRAQVAIIMARLNRDFDPEETYTCDLPDYDEDTWFENEVAFCASKGIIKGRPIEGVNMFQPYEPITRAEFAAMLVRALGLTVDADAEYGFKDDIANTNGFWAVGEINALKDAGITTGYEDGTFQPENKITRAEVVAMVNRAYGLKDAESGEKFDITFPDVTESGENSHWAWKYIMPAANVPVNEFVK